MFHSADRSGGRHVPLFAVAPEGVVPLRHLGAATGVYEKEIEELFWLNLSELIGVELFGVTRQAHLTGGGIVDILALDQQGNVTVIEVKRSIEREQLAQCLEYAGWATLTNLEEVAALYEHGTEMFWSAGQDFTGTATPQHLSRSPRLVLVASDFHPRTEAAVALLQRSALQLLVIRVTMYEDAAGARFIDASSAERPAEGTGVRPPTPTSLATVADLLRAGLLTVGEELQWVRKQKGETHSCTVLADGRLLLADGRVSGTPSGAAVGAGQVNAFDGWNAWRASAHDNKRLADLRNDYVALQQTDSPSTPAA